MNLTLRVRGEGSCSASLFGMEAASGSATIEACVSVDQDASFGCGASGGETVGGASLTVEASATAVGWLNIGAYTKTWSAGGGC